MNNNKKYYKIKLCRYYKEYKNCKNGDNCSYAHGKKELREYKIKDCNYGINCRNEECIFKHPDSWNPKNNKKECIRCVNGDYCNKTNYNYIHNENEIKNKDDSKKESSDNNIKLNDKDFPELPKNNNKNNKKDLDKSNGLSFEKICNIPLPSPTEEENITFKIESKRENIEKYKQKLNDQSLTEEQYNKIMSKINILKDEIHVLENMLSNNDTHIQNKPDININIRYNGKNMENINLNEDIENNVISDNKKQEIFNTINDMKKDFKNYDIKIKNFINDRNKDSSLKFILIDNLNNIYTNIRLFEDNFKDIIID